MSSEGTLAVAAAVVAITQLLKWARLPDAWGPLLVILLSGVGVGLWLVSGASWPPGRTDVWPVVTGWIAVALSAAGTFGFTRATASAVTSISTPPGGGAGSSPTVKAESEPALTISALADELERRRVERVQARLHTVSAPADFDPKEARP